MDNLIYTTATGDEDLKGIIAVRREVFTKEMGIPEEMVFDGHDERMLQIVVKDGETVIGTARVQFLDATKAKLERMAVLQAFRSKGIGRQIISFLDEELRDRQVKQVVLHAQHEAVAFYRSCGFKETGGPFWEVGIKHIKMHRQL
ncbi:MAG: GNAT family N-acetyltransferase [Dehalococcoidia bacterium]